MSRYEKDLIKMNPTSGAKPVLGSLRAAARRGLEQPTCLTRGSGAEYPLGEGTPLWGGVGGRGRHTCLQRHRIHLGEVIELLRWGLPAQEVLQVFPQGLPTVGSRA